MAEDRGGDDDGDRPVILTDREWWVRTVRDKGDLYVSIGPDFARRTAEGGPPGAVRLEYHPGDPSSPIAMTATYADIHMAQRVLALRGFHRKGLER
jgi:hypothetical protein